MEMDPRPVSVIYQNHKGNTRTRRIIPIRMWFGNTPYHPDPQYLLSADDMDDGVTKDFAMTGFQPGSWEVIG